MGSSNRTHLSERVQVQEHLNALLGVVHLGKHLRLLRECVRIGALLGKHWAGKWRIEIELRCDIITTARSAHTLNLEAEVLLELIAHGIRLVDHGDGSHQSLLQQHLVSVLNLLLALQLLRHALLLHQPLLKLVLSLLHLVALLVEDVLSLCLLFVQLLLTLLQLHTTQFITR